MARGHLQHGFANRTKQPLYTPVSRSPIGVPPPCLQLRHYTIARGASSSPAESPVSLRSDVVRDDRPPRIEGGKSANPSWLRPELPCSIIANWRLPANRLRKSGARPFERPSRRSGCPGRRGPLIRWRYFKMMRPFLLLLGAISCALAQKNGDLLPLCPVVRPDRRTCGSVRRS